MIENMKKIVLVKAISLGLFYNVRYTTETE